MPSPFPGMNPFLEQEGNWKDFHDTYIVALRRALATKVLPHFFVKIDEHVYLHEPPVSERPRVGMPDVGVFRRTTYGAPLLIACSMSS